LAAASPNVSFPIRKETFEPIAAADVRADCCSAEQSLRWLGRLCDPKAEETDPFGFRRLLTHSGSRRFVLTNLKCKSEIREIRIVARDLLTFEGREVRSGEALSFPRNIG
jgi:hypothetical protein